MKFLLDHDVPELVAEVLDRHRYEVVRLRNVMPMDTTDCDVLAYADENKLIVVTCNRDDFLGLARSLPFTGLIILIRRESRNAEGTALLRLIERAGETGLLGNINFA